MAAASGKVAIITGVTGQDGSYLVELLLERGYDVHGIVRRTSNLQRSRIDHLRNDETVYGKRFFLHYGDLSDPTTLRRLFLKIHPTEVYHLAGQSHVGLSFEIPESTTDEVAMATLRLLEICRDQEERPRFFNASTSEIFGAAKGSPQTEQTPISPTSPYGCAKAFATHICTVYRESYGMFICNGIMYNHESPRRGENFVTRKISRQVARIQLGLADKLVLGNVMGRRDWGHARDYVQAMWLMLQHEAADDYILATGKSHTVREFVDAAFAVIGKNSADYLQTDQALNRPSEPVDLVGNPAKAEQQLRWKRDYDFNRLVLEMVEADIASLDNRTS